MIAVLSLVCLVGVALGGQVPRFNSGYGPNPVPQPLPPTSSGLPCPQEGFYPHPEHKHRFYRCVDHSGTKTLLTVYEFNCPAGQVFVKTTDKEGLCLPTSVAAGMPGKLQPDTGRPTSSPLPNGGYNPTLPNFTLPSTTQATTKKSTNTGGSGYPTPAPTTKKPDNTGGSGYTTPARPTRIPAPTTKKPDNTGGSGYPSAGGAYPKPGNPRPPPVTKKPLTLPPIASGYPGSFSSECPHKYVQDSKHCNVYRACVADGKMYRCRTGSVFDQANQMCRWSYRADDVCKGKTLMSETQFRSFPTSFKDYLVGQNPAVSTLIQSFPGLPNAYNQDLAAGAADQSMFYLGGVHDQPVPQFYVGGEQQIPQALQPLAYTGANIEGETFPRNSNPYGVQAVPTFFPSADNPLVYYF